MIEAAVKPTPEEVEEVLRENAAELFEGDAPDHIDDDRLAVLVERKDELRPDEITHLARCSECAAVVGELFEAHREAKPSRMRRPHLSRRAPLALVAIAAAALLFYAVPDGDVLRSKGGVEGIESADVAQVAIGPGGKRDLRSGGTIRTNEQIGFKYGNLDGRHTTLTIAGWDGRRVHWYYPEAIDESPPRIDGGSEAHAVRLPFDIKVEGYPVGPLRIVAAFDADPSAVAKALESEALDALEVYRLFDVVVEAEP